MTNNGRSNNNIEKPSSRRNYTTTGNMKEQY